MKSSVAIVPLVAIDQAIKLFIHHFYNDSVGGYPLIPGLLSFSPVHNTDLSWFGSMGFKLFANFNFSVVLNLLVFVLSIMVFRFIRIHKKYEDKFIVAISIFLLSGVICSTIDRLFWKGSLDYIRLEGFFTFDLKDCYISIFIILLFYSFYRYQKFWRDFRTMQFLKELFLSLK